MSENQRLILVAPLESVLYKGGYSNLVLANLLKKTELSQQSKKQISRRFYGVLERKLALEFCIAQFSSRPLEKFDRQVLILLMIGAYELLYMDGIPSRATVNECVNVCRKIKKTSASGLVNAILRKIDRHKNQLLEKIEADPVLRFSIAPWALKELVNTYGEERAFRFLTDSFVMPPIYLRLESDDNLPFAVEKTDLPGCVRLLDTNALSNEDVMDGFYVQDKASQICATSIPVRQGNTVLDLCAAPGGKSFILAGRVGRDGTVISCDISAKKCRLMDHNRERLGITNMEILVNDASVYSEKFPKADVVLCDVPCSGFGVIRRRPEIKYKNQSDLIDLPGRQEEILSVAARYVKPGGYLVYSTCSVLSRENEDVINSFMEKNPHFRQTELLSDYFGKNTGNVTLLPPEFESDGFYICCMRNETVL